jgi:hypothetical protein
MQSPSSANALDLRPYPTRIFVVVVLIHVPPIHFSHIPITPLFSLSLSLAFSSSLPFWLLRSHLVQFFESLFTTSLSFVPPKLLVQRCPPLGIINKQKHAKVFLL